ALAPLSLPAFNSVFAPGQVGTGVTLASIERVRDSFLDLQIRHEHASQGRQQALLQAVNAMKVLFPELNAVPGAGLVTATNTLFVDFTALAAAPASGALRATLV